MKFGRTSSQWKQHSMELNRILTVSFKKRRNFLKTLTRREKSPSGKRPRTKHWFAFISKKKNVIEWKDSSQSFVVLEGFASLGSVTYW